MITKTEAGDIKWAKDAGSLYTATINGHVMTVVPCRSRGKPTGMWHITKDGDYFTQTGGGVQTALTTAARGAGAVLVSTVKHEPELSREQKMRALADLLPDLKLSPEEEAKVRAVIASG